MVQAGAHSPNSPRGPLPPFCRPAPMFHPCSLPPPPFCPPAPISHLRSWPLPPLCPHSPRPLPAADTGARVARASYKLGRASRRLREYLARFLGVSGADFNAAPLGKPPLRPPRRGANLQRLYIGISHFPPSPLLHLHLFPGLRNPSSQNFSISQKNILSHFLHPLGSLPRMDVLCGAQPERLLCQKFKLFLLRFPFVPKR